MILRMISIVALLSTLGLAGCQEEDAEAGGTEAETGTMEDSTGTGTETQGN